MSIPRNKIAILFIRRVLHGALPPFTLGSSVCLFFYCVIARVGGVTAVAIVIHGECSGGGARSSTRRINNIAIVLRGKDTASLRGILSRHNE